MTTLAQDKRLCELLTRADSYLSLLWYRPSTPHDFELSRAVEMTIADLRKESAALREAARAEG